MDGSLGFGNWLDDKSIKGIENLSYQHSDLSDNQSGMETSSNSSNVLPVFLLKSEQIDTSCDFIDIRKEKKNLNGKNWITGNYSISQIDIECKDIKKPRVYCVQISRDKIVIGLCNSQIQVWNICDYTLSQTLDGHIDSVTCVQSDTEKIISGSKDTTIRIWNISNGNLLNKLVNHTQRIVNIKFKDDILISCSFDNCLLVFNIKDLKNITFIKNLTLLEPKLIDIDIRNNAVDLNEEFLFASLSNKIGIWSKNDRNLSIVGLLVGHEEIVTCFAITETLVISGSQDKTVRIWLINTKECIKILTGHESFLFSIKCDGKKILSGSYGQIKIWDLDHVLNNENNSCMNTIKCANSNYYYSFDFDDVRIICGMAKSSMIVYDFS